MPSSSGGLAAQVLNYNTKPLVTHGGKGAKGEAAGTGLVDAIISRQVFATAKNPGATAVDNVLAVFSLPGGALDGEGNRGVRIRAIGDLGANANTKTVKLIFNPTAAVVGSTVSGGTTIASTGAVVTNGSIFVVDASVYKTGILGSNTQMSVGGLIQAGAAVVAPVASVSVTAVESAPILIAVTGNAATAVGDIGLRLFEIEGLN